MNGAEAVLRTLADSGVSLCLANPGTSEMHMVAALDEVPRMRAVLCLFEGAATGAADGYGRMAGRPAAVLLHLGPGLANGLANLHNARRARTPLLVIVGDHATYHKRFDAPLESDIEALAGSVSGWVRRSARSADAAADVAEAAAAAMCPPGQVATVILPADVTWSADAEPVTALPVRPRSPVAGQVIDAVAAVLRGAEPSVILLGGAGMHRPALEAASRVSQATGARLLAETFPARTSAARASRRSGGSPTWPRWPRRNSTGRATSSWPGRAPRCPSSPTRASSARWCRTGARYTRWPGRATTSPVRSRPWPIWPPRGWRRSRSRRSGPACPTVT